MTKKSGFVFTYRSIDNDLVLKSMFFIMVLIFQFYFNRRGARNNASTSSDQSDARGNNADAPQRKERPHACANCNRRFTTVDGLQQHTRVVHEQNDVSICCLLIIFVDCLKFCQIFCFFLFFATANHYYFLLLYSSSSSCCCCFRLDCCKG
jgi:hypothetical protein